MDERLGIGDWLALPIPNPKSPLPYPSPSLKIAVVSNSAWNIQNFRLPVIKALQSEGHEVVLVAPVDESLGAIPLGERLHFSPLKKLRRDGLDLFSNGSLFFEFLKTYRRTRPDMAIHFTIKPNIFGNLAAACLKIPSVCVVTGLGYSYLHRGFLQKATSLLYRLSFSFAQKVVFENEDDRRLFIEQKLVSPEKTATVNGCGVDLKHFSVNGIRPATDRTVFTFVGRLLLDKGISEFVEAARLAKPDCQEAEFWVLGGLDAGNPAHIRSEALSDWASNGTVRYLGHAEDVRPILARSHWVVLPSYREGLSRVLLESLAMGRPVITTDTAGCRQAVDEGENGFLVPIKDSAALAAAFVRCHRLGQEKTRILGENGRKKAEKEFGSELIGQFYARLATEILGKKN